MDVIKSGDFWKQEATATAYAKKGGDAVQFNRLTSIYPWLQTYPQKPNEKLGDVGCGSGKITRMLPLIWPQGVVLAVDYSTAMIEKAREHVNGSQLGSNITFMVSDASKLKFQAKESSLDRVVSFTAAHWFPDFEAFFEGVEFWLKPGGLFFIRYAYGGQKDETLAVAEFLRESEQWKEKFEGWECPMHTYTVDTATAAIEKAGMVLEHGVTERNIETFESRADYKAYVAGWLPHLYHLAEPDREAFLNEAVDTHCAREDRVEGEKVSVVDYQIIVWGFKPKADPGPKGKEVEAV